MGWSSGIRVCSGRVLTNSPSMVSMPGTSGGRPETGVPKVMSVRFSAWERVSAQAPCTIVLTVRSVDLARRVSWSVVA